MKFTKNSHKLLFILINISILYLTFSYRTSLGLKSSIMSGQMGIEQQVLSFNIYNNNSEFISSNDVNIKLIQNQQEVNSTNKYVGYFRVTVKDSHKNFTPFDFENQIPNFGKEEGEDRINVDFRYIIGCYFEVREESTTTEVRFQMVSKESTSQHVYNIVMKLPTEGNKMSEVKKYFDNIQKICTSTQETAVTLREDLMALFRDNLAKKKLKLKLEGKGGDNSTTPSEDAKTPEDPKRKQLMEKFFNNFKNQGFMKNIYPDMSNTTQSDKNNGQFNMDIADITDPETKTKLETLQANIKKQQEKIVELQTEKKRLVGRSHDILNRLDRDNQELTVLKPKQEVNANTEESAQKTVLSANNRIPELTKATEVLNKTVSLKSETKAASEKMVKTKEEELSTIKTELNMKNEQVKEIKKQITDIETKAKVETEELNGLEKKKATFISTVSAVQKEIKTGDDDIENFTKTMNSIQSSLNTLKEEEKKVEQEIKELKEKTVQLMKKEIDIKKNIDPKVISQTETQKQAVLTKMSEDEEVLTKIKDEVVAFIDPIYATFINQAFAQVSNKENFDPESYKKILKNIPEFIWTPQI